MSMNDLNFGDLFQESTTVLTGEFDVIFVKGEATFSSNQKPMIKYQASVEGGPSHGHIFYGQFTISRESSAALRIFFTQMEVLGFNQAYMNALPRGQAGLAQLAADLVGKRARIDVESRPWQGVDRESVKGIKPGVLTGPIPGGLAGAAGPTPTPAGPPVPGGVPSVPAAPSVPTSTPQTPPQVPTTPATQVPPTPAPAPVVPTPAPAATSVPEASTTGDAPPPLPY